MLQCHGDSDNMVNLQFGAMTSALIKGFCNDYRFKKYDGLGHSSSIQVSNNRPVGTRTSVKFHLQCFSLFLDWSWISFSVVFKSERNNTELFFANKTVADSVSTLCNPP